MFSAFNYTFTQQFTAIGMLTVLTLLLFTIATEAKHNSTEIEMMLQLSKPSNHTVDANKTCPASLAMSHWRTAA